MPSGVVLKASVRRAFATAALIHQNNAIALGIKKTAVTGLCTASWATVNKKNRNAIRTAAFFKINGMQRRHRKHGLMIGLICPKLSSKNSHIFDTIIKDAYAPTLDNPFYRHIIQAGYLKLDMDYSDLETQS